MSTSIVLTKSNFCMICGAALKWRYPGGDPENGPANPRCSKDQTHGGPEDWFQDRLMDEMPEIEADFLEKLACGYRESPDEPRSEPYTRFAAEVIQAHMHMLKVHCERDHYQYQKRTWEVAPWYGNECDDLPPTRMQTFLHLTRRR